MPLIPENHLVHRASACTVLIQLNDILSQLPEEPFILHCDTSQEGLGAVLYQLQQGKLVVMHKAQEHFPTLRKITTFIQASWSFLS